jgi:competence protein CoiA
MLCAKRKSTGELFTADMALKTYAPFVCPDCLQEVVLKTGKRSMNHFAHVNPLACQYAQNESDQHRRCKMEIYETLLREPGVRDAALERPLGSVRPDVSAFINDIPIAIEVQISSLSPETIQHRTIEYARKGIYVLWLLPWTADLDAQRYAPQLWEKWIHAAYFGRVYYWIKGLTVACYHFDPNHIAVPKTSWYSKQGKKKTAGGYSHRSKRYRAPRRGGVLNLATDFVPKDRDWWQGSDLTIPAAKIFIDPYRHSTVDTEKHFTIPTFPAKNGNN